MLSDEFMNCTRPALYVFLFCLVMFYLQHKGRGKATKVVKGAANLKVQLIVQKFCMHFNFEFWRSKQRTTVSTYLT